LFEYFDCESYVYGVLDAYLAVSEIIPKQQRACFPRAIEPWRVLEDVRELLENGNGENIAGQAIIKALVIKYPCK